MPCESKSLFLSLNYICYQDKMKTRLMTLPFLLLFLTSCGESPSCEDVFHYAEDTKMVNGNLMIYDYNGEIFEERGADSGIVLCRQQNIAGTNLYCAVLPEENYVAMHGCDVEIRLFQHQEFAYGNMDSRYNPQVAFGRKDQQKLRYVNGGIRLGLVGDVLVTALRFTDNDTMNKIWGNYVVKNWGTDAERIFALSSSEGDNVLWLDCPEGVQLSPDSATDFTVKVPPGAFYRGFELDVFSGGSLISHLSTSDSVNVHFGKILLMPVVEIKKCHEE